MGNKNRIMKIKLDSHEAHNIINPDKEKFYFWMMVHMTNFTPAASAAARAQDFGPLSRQHFSELTLRLISETTFFQKSIASLTL